MITISIYAVLVFSRCQRDKTEINNNSAPKVQGFNRAGVYAAFYSSDGRQVAVGMGNGEVCLLGSDSLELLWRKKIADAPVHSTLFHPNKQVFAAPCYNGVAYLCHTDSALAPLPVFGEALSVNHAGFSAGGQLLAAVGQDSMLRIFSYPALQLLCRLRHPCPVNYFWFTQHDSVVVVSGADGNIYRWNVHTFDSLTLLRGHRRAVYSVFANVAGRVVVSASADSTVRLWDLDTGHCTRTYNATDTVYVAMLSPNGHWLAWCQSNAEVVIKHLPSGKTFSLKGHTGLLCSLHFSPNGEHLLTGSMDGTLRLWQVGTGNCLLVKEMNR